MAASKTGICNMALGHLGVGQTISDIVTEDSAEARVCRLYWDVCKNSTLRDYTWPFATQFQALDLIEEDPTSEWGFSYRYPVACLDVRRIITGSRNDSVASRAPYVIGSDNSGLIIYTDEEDAEIEFTAKCDNPVIYPPDYELALSLRLAAYIAPTVTRGDAFKLGLRALQLYETHVGRAIATAKNEESKGPEAESSFITARE